MKGNMPMHRRGNQREQTENQNLPRKNTALIIKISYEIGFFPFLKYRFKGLCKSYPQWKKFIIEESELR